MEFRVLGPLEVRDGDGPLALGGAKQRALLAVLLLNPNEVLSSDRLIEELWGERPPDTAGKALQGYVSALRKVLEPDRRPGEPNRLLLTRASGYVLKVDPDQLDLTRFETLRGEARGALAAGDAAAARSKLEEALSLWRGRPLADFSYERFAQTEIARLEELRLTAIEERIEADLALGRHGGLVAELEALVAEHPLRERFRAQLMLALYRSGRQAEALETYRNARRELVELGIEPGRELKQLEQAVLIQDPSLEVEPRTAQAPERVETETSADFPAKPVRADRREGSFVGREHELGELLEGVDAALKGDTTLFLIAGEPGIGKSRLAGELSERARARGAKVLWGRCWEAGGAPAYWPWVQALRAYVREADSERIRAELGRGAADVAQVLPELHELFPDLPPQPSLDPEGARFRLFDSTASFLRSAGATEPLVLVIDDMHAADTPSLLLLRFMARELRDARLVLIGSYRDTEIRADEALGETLAELRREPITHPVRLGGLSLPEVRSFVELIASTRPDDGLAAAVHRETEGNPLFVGELVRLLASEGRLDEAGSAAWSLSVPQGVRDVIGHRLRHLSEDCKRLLSVASVLGRDFRLDALEQVSGRSGEELLDLLDEAAAAGVIEEPPAGRGGLRFSHALIRDSLYRDLGRKDRRRLHRRTAEALESLYGPNREPHLAELAHHFLQAGPDDLDRGIDYARRAGDHAAAILAYEEAARLYGMALEALESKLPPDESARCELLLALGDSEGRGGNVPSAKEIFVRAAEVAKRLDRPEQLARAALGYGGRFIWFRSGKDERLIPLLEDALGAQPAGDSKLRAMLLARLAGALRDYPVPERRTELSHEAVAISRRLGDRTTLAYALEGTYAALSWPREVDTWLATVNELTRLAEEAGDREQAFAGHLHAFGTHMLKGDLRAVGAELRVISALAEELRQPAQRWALAIARGMVALFEGRLDEADRQMQRGAELGRRGQGLDATFYFVTNLQTWAMRRAQGRLVEVQASLESFVDEYPAFSMLRCVLASLYADLGLTVEAREQLDRLATDNFAALHLGTEWFFGSSLLAEVCAFLGDTARAERLYEAMLPYGNYNVISHPEVSLGSASRYLGLLATTMSRWREAARHFEEALAMNDTMGALPWIARSKDDYARMLAARGEPGDNERALELVEDALKAYRELEMAGWAQSASELSKRLAAGSAPEGDRRRLR